MPNKKATFNPREFWDDKILGWETSRYGQVSDTTGQLEKVARLSSDSVKRRLELSRKILAPNCIGKKLVEYGCGSARLAEPLIESGASSYFGFDLAPSAITSARQRISNSPHANFIQLEATDIGTAAKVDADIVISLGLTDWLDSNQLEQLILLSQGRDFLHSFSERRSGLRQRMHRLYVHLAYGRKTSGYVPRYYVVDDIVAQLERGRSSPVSVVRLRELSFGVLVTSLPIPAELL